MIKYHVVAEILWQKPEQIRQKINSGQTTYALNIKFKDVDGLWSAVLILEDLVKEEVRSEQPQMVKMGFLFPDQVKELLAKNIRFEILEGPSVLLGLGKIMEIANL
jgi:hypothetical protein